MLLRSYAAHNTLEDIKAKIWEAARATSAATSFFDPIIIQGMGFVDGALGANNPIGYLWNEAQNIWCDDEVGLPQKLNCYVSIGTGNPGIKPVGTKKLTQVFQTLADIATQTVETADSFADTHRQVRKDGRYYRFDVSHGLELVELKEYKRQSLIQQATRKYMHRMDGSSQACAKALAARV